MRAARVDAVVPLSDIDGEFVAAHEMLEPFGAGNPQPLFMTRRAKVAGTRTFAEDCCELTMEGDGVRMAAVLWPSVKQLGEEMVRSGTVDFLFNVEPDVYASSGAKLIVVDARPAA